ncbi:MAG: hypothetical protein RL766_1277 [Bacteroidota bacterium]
MSISGLDGPGNEFLISELLIYPVKSLGGISVKSAVLTDRGFDYDRRFMLIDAHNRFVTQREFPELAFFKTAILGNQLSITDKRDGSSVAVSLIAVEGEQIGVQIWDDHCQAMLLDNAIADWFSARLSQPVQLVYMPDESHRRVDPAYAGNGELTSFSDGYPVLIIGEESLKGLNARLENPIPMDRFRPNIVFSGGYPHVEDTFNVFRAGGVELHAVKPCARCVMTTTDQETGQRTAEPLQTLSKYRRQQNKIYFGQNLLASNTGEVRLGDHLIVLSTKQSLFNH